MNSGVASESPARRERENIDATRGEIAERECVRARCVDCDTTYRVDTKEAQASAAEPTEKKHKRKTKADYRAEIEPAPPPPAGFNTTVLEQALAAGPAGIRQAQKIAL